MNFIDIVWEGRKVTLPYASLRAALSDFDEQERAKIYEYTDKLYAFVSQKDVKHESTSDKTLIERIEYEGGIKTYLVGHPYPMKGCATPDAVRAINVLKRLTRDFVFLFVGFKRFNFLAFTLMEPYILKSEYQTPTTRAVQTFIETFLKELGFKPQKTCITLAQSLACVVQYDDAYRFRLQDLFSETTPERLAFHPQTEILRLLKINRERESSSKTSRKLQLIGRLIALAFLLPPVRRAFEKAILDSTFPNLQLDEGDIYWTLYRKDYNFRGLTYGERQTILRESYP